MSLPLSREVGAVLRKAEELSGALHQPMSTAHVLLAIFEVSDQAAKLLSDRSITVGRLREQMSDLGGEQSQLLTRVRERSQRLASGSRADAVSSLHLLAALVRESSSQAYALLDGCGVDIGAVRTAVMSYATSSRPVPRSRPTPLGVRSRGAAQRRRSTSDSGDQQSPSPIGFHPSLGVGRSRDKGEHRSCEPSPSGHESLPADESLPVEESSPFDESSPSKTARSTEVDDGSSPRDSGPYGAIENLRETGGGLALDNHPGINRGGKPRPTRQRRSMADTKKGREQDEGEGLAKEQRRKQEARQDAEKTTRDLAERLFSDRGDVRDEGEIDFPPIDEESPTGLGAEESHGRIVDAELADEYRLDCEQYPNLSEFGRNLTVDAAMGEIDPVIGRREEISQMIDILGKRRSNNPLLVGEPGVGKTAIVEGLAGQLVEMARDGKSVGRRKIIELEMGRILSGTHLRGAFSERLLGIKDEVAAAGGDVVVFLDEIHMWMSAGASGDGGDAPGELKTALARGQFPCIGATTHDECRKFVESDPAFERRFQRIHVEEPDEDTALRIVEGVRTHYERHHGVAYTLGALAASVTLAVRYVHDRQLPDKAIGVLDLAGSRAARQGLEQVDREAVAQVVADMASIPADRLTGSDGTRFLHMESFLADGVVGHDDVVVTISELLRRNYAGFRSHRPIGSLLFLGPTGVGKTEMVKVLADFLFHDREAMTRIDMSEFMESHSVSRLIGAPPGYVGHDQGGQLTKAIRRRPYQVVLLDEIEKAHSDVLNLLLQLFDEGRLTDGGGREVDFSNALIVMTSNLGSQVFERTPRKKGPSIGFSGGDGEPVGPQADDEERCRQQVLKAAREHFTPELWNRIDERLVFMPLSRDEIAEIAKLQLAESEQRLREESEIEMSYEPDVIDYLIENGGYDRRLGARPMRQTIQRLVEGAVARAILAGRVEEGGQLRVVVEDDEITVHRQ